MQARLPVAGSMPEIVWRSITDGGKPRKLLHSRPPSPLGFCDYVMITAVSLHLPVSDMVSNS